MGGISSSRTKTMTYMSTVQNFEARLGRSLSRVVADYRERNRQYRVYRRTLGELSALSDRELSDLGIHRSAIRSIAHKAAYGA